MEPRRNHPDPSRDQKLRILRNLHFAELFERFLHTRYQGQKRFSLEGAETLIPLLDAMVEKSGEADVREIIIGMAHRGRLNVLATILHKPFQEIFVEFEGNIVPDSIDGDGDVKYHLGFSSDRKTASGNVIHLSLTPNPSHLEAVNPVVEGRARAKQKLHKDKERKQHIPLLIHGDAAFAGQGLVAETLNLSQLNGYTTGGTLHVVVNNQIGFTTTPNDARSTTYCTDVAKMIQAPIFHVNAEDPEAAFFLAELAVEFRQTFRRDVVIDLYCYRKHGHNEGDEPSYTQPVMYRKIKNRPSLSEIYTNKLIERGDLTKEESAAIDQEYQQKLNKAQQEVKADPHLRGMPGFDGRWKGLLRQYSGAQVPTGVPYDVIREITEAITRVPADFNLNPNIAKILESRQDEIAGKKTIGWAFAESLAFAALLREGTPVRLSGQDSRRGTFSTRHAVLNDSKTGDRYVPMNNMKADQSAALSVYDSMLAEASVLGFEFGFSCDDPHTLVLWEAQFGDFANGAQVIIDQFIVCSESKWQRASGLVMLLPHGYEGQGPEHSSARLERFLQLFADDNIQVAYPTTPAQYFHILRRQVRRNFRKPLVIMTPKSLLRSKDARSPVDDLVTGRFQEVLDDTKVDAARVRRVVFCTGKVHYDLRHQRDESHADDVAIVRVEQLAPFPEEQIKQTLARYRRASEWVWVQEESQNMGAWSFVEPRMRALGQPVEYIGRDASASPATGSSAVHQREQRELVEAAMSGSLPYLVRAVPPRRTPQLARMAN
jgi:2-oxoglutarate dehydrogenase E1 component